MVLKINVPERPKSAIATTEPSGAVSVASSETKSTSAADTPSTVKAHYYSQLSVMLFEKSFEDNPLFPEDLDRVHSWFVNELTDTQKVVCLHELLSQMTPSQHKFLFTSVSFDASLPCTAAEELAVWKDLKGVERDEQNDLSLSSSRSRNKEALRMEQRFKSLDLTTFSPNGEDSLFSGLNTEAVYKLPSDKSSSVHSKTPSEARSTTKSDVDDFKLQIENSFYNDLYKSGIDFDIESTARQHEILVHEAEDQLSGPPGFLSPMASEFRPSEPSCYSEVYFVDFSRWLRLTRLHKYFSTLNGVYTADPGGLLGSSEGDLEAVGVAAMGARKKFLRLFQRIRDELSKQGLK